MGKFDNIPVEFNHSKTSGSCRLKPGMPTRNFEIQNIMSGQFGLPPKDLGGISFTLKWASPAEIQTLTFSKHKCFNCVSNKAKS